MFLALQFNFIIGFSQINNAFGQEEEEETEKEYIFSIRLIPNQSGGLIQCLILKGDIKKPEKILLLTTNSWVMQATGYESSKANPKTENLIQKYKIFEIPEEVTKTGEKEILFYSLKKTEAILNNLWRLKYSEYPYYNPEKNNDKGWARHSDLNITWLPSEAQMRILNEYGIENFGDFISEENTFRLLRDVRDKDWQTRYIQSAGVSFQTNEDSTSNHP
jgi:hypothetical protein